MQGSSVPSRTNVFRFHVAMCNATVVRVPHRRLGNSTSVAVSGSKSPNETHQVVIPLSVD